MALSPHVSKFLAFGVAGGGGFVVDAAVLYLLAGTLGPYGARALSFLAAVFTTWIINRNFAFRMQRAGTSLWREFAGYLGAMIVGGAANYGVYALLVATVPLVAEHLVLGLVAGTLAGMAINYLLADRLVFRAGSKSPSERRP